MEETAVALIRKRRQGMGAALVVALIFYFCLPLSLIFIPEYMNLPSIFFGIPWAWFYAFLQIPMTWFFCLLYHQSAKKFETQMEQIYKEDSR